MATQATGNHGAQSIGPQTTQAVDGIAGSHPGTQEPSGAHVDAGGAGAGPGQQTEEPAPAKDTGVRTGTGQPVGGLSGMSGQGIAQPRGATGALGSHALSRMTRLEQVSDPMYAGNWTGAIARGGKLVAVPAASGSLSRQHSSGK